MLLDLTQPLSEEMSLYPATEAPQFAPCRTLAADGYRERLLRLTSHTGTHMDAPAHLLPQGRTLDSYGVERFCGTALVLDCRDIGQGGTIPLSRLQADERIQQVDYVLFYTNWSRFWGQAAYLHGFPTLSEEAAQYLAALPLKGIGVDALSVDPVESETFPVHKTLLQSGMLLVENLGRLGELAGQVVWFSALPLPIKEADGAPVRAIAITEGEC